MKTIIQITKTGTGFLGSDDDLKLMREEFKKQYCIKLPNFVEPGLLKFIQHKIKQGGFYEDRYKVGKGDATDYRLKDKSTDSLLRFLINDQDLFQLIEQITGCSQIRSFNGAVYSLASNCGHYDTWHKDDWDNRMISMSINLSTDIYSGGVLQIRDCKSKKILNEVTNTGFGDAVIFLVSPQMEHKVTDVEGKVAKIAFPGWFKSKPSYKSLLKKLHQFKNKTSDTKLTISRHSTVVEKKELFSRTFENELLIFNPENTVCHGLNPIGERILNLVKEPMTVEEIQDVILHEYDIKPKQCEQDIVTLLQELVANEIVAVQERKFVSTSDLIGVRT